MATTTMSATRGDLQGDRRACSSATSKSACGLPGQGVENVNPGNHGGTIDCGGFTVSFVNALHSSSLDSGRPARVSRQPAWAGRQGGRRTDALPHGRHRHLRRHGADQRDLTQPEIGIVPIGDRFTMGAKTAAIACKRFFDFRLIVPMHYATFPDARPDGRQVRGGDGRRLAEGCRAGARGEASTCEPIAGCLARRARFMSRA